MPFIDEHGTLMTPQAPNAIKFERFIFDLMPLATKVCVIEVDPAEGFAPLKNPPGAAADTLGHVQAALVAHARRLIERSGARVADGIDVELDAIAILDEADIARAIPPGTRIERPIVVGRSRESTLPRR